MTNDRSRPGYTEIPTVPRHRGSVMDGARVIKFGWTGWRLGASAAVAVVVASCGSRLPANEGFAPPPTLGGAPLSIRLEPVSVARGGSVVVHTDSASPGNWVGSTRVSLDKEGTDGWRTLWGSSASEWGNETQDLRQSNDFGETLAVGIAVTQDVTFPIPSGAQPGEYRLCRLYNEQPSTGSVYVCAAVTIT